MIENKVEGLDVTVTLTCTKCGTETSDSSQDPDYSGDAAISDNGWEVSGSLCDKLVCDDCAEAEDG
jgi:hypothetical protein